MHDVDNTDSLTEDVDNLTTAASGKDHRLEIERRQIHRSDTDSDGPMLLTQDYTTAGYTDGGTASIQQRVVWITYRK